EGRRVPGRELAEDRVLAAVHALALLQAAATTTATTAEVLLLAVLQGQVGAVEAEPDAHHGVRRQGRHHRSRRRCGALVDDQWSVHGQRAGRRIENRRLD